MRSARISWVVLVAALVGLMALASAASADFGVKPGSFESTLRDSTDTAETDPQAGAHPSRQQVKFDFNTMKSHEYPNGEYYPGSGPYDDTDGQLKTVVTELPPGLIGNPQAVPTCSGRDFPPAAAIGPSRCPTDSQVGVVVNQLQAFSGQLSGPFQQPLYNLTPPKGVLARLGFVQSYPLVIDLTVRSGGDYGLTATLRNVSQAVNIFGTSVTIWGVPADTSHDAQRYRPDAFFAGTENGEPLHSGADRSPFLSNPTRCGVELPSFLHVASWADPDNFLPYTSAPMHFTGCSQVDFNPSIELHPTTTVADAPTGLDFDLHIPQNLDPDGLTTAHLRDAVVKLPEGMTINPPSAEVLDSCSLDQVGMSAAGVANSNPVACPDASILGKATVITPSLKEPVPGTVYLARQSENPFGSIFAMYLVLDDPDHGLLIKLPGRIDPDPKTGQLTVSFRENPQLPTEDIKMSLFGGPHASLKTPEGCGKQITTASLTPWTAPEAQTAQRQSAFDLTNGPDGGACRGTGAKAPKQVSFVAGNTGSKAKAFSPFTFKVSRPDGSQQIKVIDTTLPKGLIGKLAGISYCNDNALAAAAGKSGRSEQSSPSCPASSRVGGVEVGGGAGATPLYVAGNAYLAGPYKGAPLSLAVITPAVAGPFDLGTVVVRNALFIDPETAQVRAVSDPLPTILKGVPLNLRSVTLTMDRPGFTLNPTNCSPSSVTGSAATIFDQTTPLSSPFQVDECGGLKFRPKLALGLKGGTARGDYPALTAILNARPGDANIAGTSVAMPHSEFLAQNHIRTICTRVQFAADACPAGSIYGSARAITPLLDKPLEGPVYLRSSSNPLPDLVAALHGQIDVDLVGRIDSKNGGIRTTFDAVPDAPVTKFVLSMKGGNKGLLQNSRNLCKSLNRATVLMDAQNGKTADSRPVLTNSCKKAAKHGGGKKRHGR